jgi:Histidine kinase-, DNA gyrase B-, and HSP90-like ATPase
MKSEDKMNTLFPTFGDSFLSLHAGRVMDDPRIALVELVANCWDAGADRVDIQWPDEKGGTLYVNDNGTGMTRDEFVSRWRELNYNRLLYQGSNVEFPPGLRRHPRVSFGRNGIGRHAMFCFSDEYYVETKKDGTLTRAHVKRTSGATPFNIEFDKEERTTEHGTKIYTEVWRSAAVLSEDSIADLIGAQFVADPEFEIYVNGNHVSLTDLEHLCERQEVTVDGIGTVLVRRFDSETAGRTSKQHGVAWWVNRRLVGKPSWEGYAEPLLDARTAIAKRYTYVVEADFLQSEVKPDWTGFYKSEKTNAVQKRVYEHIRDDLRGLSYDERRERKRAALAASKGTIRNLPLIAQEQVAEFAEELQLQCPTMSPRDLENAVSVLANLEKARSGYSLLEKLATLDPDDLDGLHQILDEWSIADAKKVLGELRYRLNLIQQLEDLVEAHTTDELHDLQPLFERGLWIFGPQFESISFTSNRTLATVIRKFFGSAALMTPQKRPDFVVLPDSSIGVYSADAFDKNHEVSGLSSIIIVELKRGGFTISHDEKDQAMKYSRELRTSGKVGKTPHIVCYVLGASVNPAAEDESREGNTTIYPRTYNTVLKQAHARTFNLLQKVELAKNVTVSDEDLNEVVHMGRDGLFPES